MVVLLTALFLSASPLEAPPSFQASLLDDAALAGSTGNSPTSAGARVGFIALGIVGTTATLLLPSAFALIDPTLTIVGVILFPFVTPALHVGLGHLLGIDVTWASAFVGFGMGLVAGTIFGTVGAFVGLAVSTDWPVFLFYAALGSAIGYIVGTPAFTLLDPFDFSRPAVPSNAPETPVRIETRPIGASVAEPLGFGVPLFAQRF